jgi:hypothetical protein
LSGEHAYSLAQLAGFLDDERALVQTGLPKITSVRE